MISPIEEKLAKHLEVMLAALLWKFERQVRFGRYTADFVVETSGRRFVVEADGHAYHDRTDEQADKDRARDRWFLRQGIVTIRFSSSEIFRNAEACATEVIRTIAGHINERVPALMKTEPYGFEGISPIGCKVYRDVSCVGGSGDNCCGGYVGGLKTSDGVIALCIEPENQ